MLSGRWARVIRAVVVAAVTSFATVPAPAQQAQPAAEDPAFERRVTAIAEELRCLVCQNQTIADSNADLAIDLKRQIREQLRAGRTDRQVVDFMVERYGDFVLYRPPLKATTAALWFGPLALGVIAVVTVVVLVRRRRRADPSEALSDSERQQAAELLAPETGERTR